MGNDKIDLVKASKPIKNNLLMHKYNIPVENLSFEYITDCKNYKEVEKIVIILRSGEEGYFPDLTKHAENRLKVLKPDSTVLREAQPVKSTKMLRNEEQQEIQEDINEWMKKMHLKEKDLKDGKSLNLGEQVPQPDVRKIVTKSKTIVSNTDIKNQNSHGKIGSCDYAAWDKFDADTEIERVDLREEIKQVEAKRAQKKQNERFKNLSKESVVNKLTLTGTELSVMAEQEREKGNEAFKAGDYEEALELYNSSLTLDSTISAYNNRAMTYIKLKKFREALEDCNKVLSMDYVNIKALLRRGLSLEKLENNKQALHDYEAVLKLEPTNKVAINAVKKLRAPCESKKVRMKIEEEDPRRDEELSGYEMWRRMQEERYGICFCDKAPSSSHYSRPLPHRKGSYCYEIPPTQSSGSKNATASNATPKSTSNPTPKSISNTTPNSTPNPTQKLISNTTPKSISNATPKSPFNTTPKESMAVPKPSTVVIQEISSDTHENNNSKSIDTVPKIKQDAEQIMKSGEENNTLDLERIEKAVTSPYEFICAWDSLSRNSDSKNLGLLLRRLEPENLNLFVGNKLDGRTFSSILCCLEQNFCNSTDAELLFKYLNSLSQCKRLSILTMFRDKSDDKALRNIFDFLGKQKKTPIDDLRKVFLPSL